MRLLVTYFGRSGLLKHMSQSEFESVFPLHTAVLLIQQPFYSTGASNQYPFYHTCAVLSHIWHPYACINTKPVPLLFHRCNLQSILASLCTPLINTKPASLFAYRCNLQSNLASLCTPLINTKPASLFVYRCNLQSNLASLWRQQCNSHSTQL